ncbi:MAG: hypothetical protein HY547_09080 [Elusimicrobia bacterium]|nr:hypothetical protein [Elusimicrobiota bacterium]
MARLLGMINAASNADRGMLASLGRPWQAPQWALLTLIGLNRFIMEQALGLHAAGEVFRVQSLWRLAQLIFGSYILAFMMALCMTVTSRILRMARMEDILFNEFLPLSITAQSGYLLAAPLSLVIMGAGEFFGAAGRVALMGRALAAVLALSIPPVLFVAIRRRIPQVSESAAMTLTLAPFLFFLGFIFTGVGALIFLIAAAVSSMAA